jgi:uncharacterized membrane protein YraQ (UPF0718 family)
MSPVSIFLGTLHGAVLMLWETLWALVLGFGLSAVLQVFVRRESIMSRFGHTDWRSVGLATFLGAVSSSCSYAATASARTAFKKGADLVPTLAFMFASTNLVLELGCVLWILLGWRFVLAEVVGAFVLIGVMWLLVRLTLPAGLVEEARAHGEEDESGGCCGHGGHDHEHGSGAETAPSVSRLSSWAAVGDSFFMDVSMMWKEIVIGFLIAGFLMAAVPQDWWKGLFLVNGPAALRLVENAVVGVIIAMASFVCSVGNLPLASLLWSGGIGFGGVISFIYADLVIVPLLFIYRKYYGLRAAAYISGVLIVSMIVAGIVVDLLFNALGLVPTGPRPPSLMRMAHLEWNYTSWLDLIALLLIAGLFAARWLRPKSDPDAHAHHHHEPAEPEKSLSH